MAALGPDPLADSFTVPALAKMLAGRRTQIKGVLRDQKIIAGIGNAYSDEVLHAARMSPFRLAASLTDDEVAGLHAAIVSTLREAVDRSAGRAAGELKAERSPGCGCTAGPASPARCAVTRCARCRSRIPRCSTAPPARPAANHWPTGGCPGCSARQPRRDIRAGPPAGG